MPSLYGCNLTTHVCNCTNCSSECLPSIYENQSITLFKPSIATKLPHLQGAIVTATYKLRTVGHCPTRHALVMPLPICLLHRCAPKGTSRAEIEKGVFHSTPTHTTIRHDDHCPSQHWLIVKLNDAMQRGQKSLSSKQ